MIGVDKAFCFILCVGSVASEEARKWSGAKKNIGEGSKPSVAWRGTKKAREPLNFLCIMILLVRSLTVDK